MGEGRERVAALPRSLFAKGPRVCPSRENEKGGGDDRRVREREGCRAIWNGEPKKYRVKQPHNMTNIVDKKTSVYMIMKCYHFL